MRQRRRLLAAGTTLLLAALAGHAPAPAEERTDRAESVDAGADAVRTAHLAGDASALAAWAGREEPDPWRVAEELLARGDGAAAEALAIATPRTDLAGLSAYIAARRASPPTPGATAALTEAEATRLALTRSALGPPPRPLDRAGVEALLARLSVPATSGDTVIAAWAGFLRADGQQMLLRNEAAAAEFADAGERAARIGWLRHATTCLTAATDVARRAGDLAGARRHAEARLAVARRRGDARLVAVAEVHVGVLLNDLGDLDEARRRYEVAIPVFRATGDRSNEANAVRNLGAVHLAAGRHAEAESAFEETLALEQALGRVTFLTLMNLGVVAKARGDLATARRRYEEALALDPAPRAPAALEYRASALYNLGRILLLQPDPEGAAARYEEALAIFERLGAIRGRVLVLGALGRLRADRGRAEEGERMLREALALSEQGGTPADVANSLRGLATHLAGRRAYGEAMPLLERARRMHEEQRARVDLLPTLFQIARVLHGMGRDEEAARIGREALALAEEVGSQERRGEVRALLGSVLTDLGSLDEARGMLLAACETARRIGDGATLAQALGALSHVEVLVGRVREAVAAAREAVSVSEGFGALEPAATRMVNLGLLLGQCGRPAEGMRLLEEALVRMRALGSLRGESYTLSSMADLTARNGFWERSLILLEQAESLQRQLGAADLLVDTLSVKASLVFHERGPEAARGVTEEAVRLAREVGTPHAQARNLAAQGMVLLGCGEREQGQRALAEAREMFHARGDAENAARFELYALQARLDTEEGALLVADLERLLAGFEARGSRDLVPDVLWALGRARSLGGDTAGALRDVREAARVLDAAFGGLAEEESASARSRRDSLFLDGASAGALLGDAEAVLWFLERGRARSLLEALGGRAAYLEAALPEALRAAEAAARADVVLATSRLRERRDATRAERRQMQRDLATAQEEFQGVVRRVQREVRAASDLAAPPDPTVAQVAERLGAGDALVLYALPPDRPAGMALVLTKEGARVVGLPGMEEVRHAGDAFAQEGGRAAEHAHTLKRLLVAPLGLPEGVRRVLLAPDGVAAYIPFTLLLEGRDVVYVPSATTYLVLGADAAPAGEGVLALGDPAYDAPAAGVGALRAGTRLARLPATRAEAEAVGTRVLLGEEATEAGFRRALAETGRRWRAVHLACHGIVDASRPLLSALALTPGEGDDGFLTPLELHGVPVRADLVVLSACETARGRVYRGEGILGLVRAFLAAGARSVLASLWKVDDEATRALMVRFYERWNPDPGAGTQGGPRRRSAAEALREAQDFVRSHPQWRDPQYWAAWTLWGTGD